jgi:hypothetical protein
MLIKYENQFLDDRQEIPGIVVQCLFQLFDLRKPQWEQYPSFVSDITEEEYRGSYGVCDNVENLFAVYPELLAPGREFTVSMTPIYKDACEAEDDWRWHKWGDYIGSQEPTHEYMYDEPVIELVYCFHIYEKVA